MSQDQEPEQPTDTQPNATSQDQELGFGKKVYPESVRFINADGSPNVRKVGRDGFRPYDMYQKLITMHWWKFGLLIFSAYFIVNLFFSAAYLLIGMDSLVGVTGNSSWERFLDAFFFSAQTITTLGYGRISPMGATASTVAAIESLFGLLGFALATGLLYGRFSRPSARIKFSTHALVAPYEGGRGLMFRMANERTSDLIEAEVQVMLSYIDLELGKRDFDVLELEINRINLFALSWTVVHPIVESSPIWKWDMNELLTRDVEVIILVKAFETTFSNTVYQRHSYKASEILFGRKFLSTYSPVNGMLEIDFRKLSDTEAAPI